MRQQWVFLGVLAAFSAIFVVSGCKGGKKGNEATTAHTDSIATAAPVNTINLPHADTSFIPLFSKILDQAFEASSKKDYAKLASLIVYRGVDSVRFASDVFSLKNNTERGVIRITAEVFNKWNNGIENRDYSRVFEMDQPGGRKMEVMEVIFISKGKLDRKFFGFIKIKDDYKIADVTSYL